MKRETRPEGSVAGDEADPPFPGGLGRRRQLADRIEYDFELCVVPLLQSCQLAGQIGVRRPGKRGSGL